MWWSRRPCANRGYDLPIHIVQVTTAGQEYREFEDAEEPELRTFMFTDVVGYVNN